MSAANAVEQESTELDDQPLVEPLSAPIEGAPQAVPGMLLIGDAAGAVNPFNGEGIAYAMESGEIAANAMAEAHYRGAGTASVKRET